MSEQSFEYLLKKYLNGQCTSTERQLVEQWYELLGKDIASPQTDAEWQATKAEIWAKVQRLTIPTAKSPIPSFIEPSWRTSPFKVITKIAASIVLTFGLGYWLWTYQQLDNQIVEVEKGDQTEWQNPTSKATVVKLSDGSRVRLQPNSSVSAPKVFSDSLRETVLTGDAFFDVTPDANRPFLVRVGNVVTRVLGTSFWVLNRAGKRVEVEVKTGKVAVFERQPKDFQNNGVLLTPNHKVTYFADDQHFVTGIIEKPEIIKTPDAVPIKFLFENTPLTEVIATLEKGYGIKIELTDEALKNCTLTGDLDNLEMHDKLRLICQSLKASYDVRGTSILISGKGCE